MAWSGVIRYARVDGRGTVSMVRLTSIARDSTSRSSARQVSRGRHGSIGRAVGPRAQPMNGRTGRMSDAPGRLSHTPERRPGGDAMRRGGGLRHLPDLLGKILDPTARRRGLAETRVLTDWPRIVGEVLAARCQPVKLTGGSHGQGGVLHLHVAGSAGLELQHSEPQLLERINSYFGYPAVARLRPISAPLALPRDAASAPPPPLDAAQHAEIEAVVRPVADDALRAALAGLGATLKARSGPAASQRGKHG